MNSGTLYCHVDIGNYQEGKHNSETDPRPFSKIGQSKSPIYNQRNDKANGSCKFCSAGKVNDLQSVYRQEIWHHRYIAARGACEVINTDKNESASYAMAHGHFIVLTMTKEELWHIG